MGEAPEQVIRMLVREGRKMPFLAADNSATPTIDQADAKLQTALSADLLKTRLLAIHYAARASIEEQGANTLFLAAGFLRWIDPGHGPEPLRAPLVLVPVELERSNARERFRLRHNGGEIEPNLSLLEKLRAEIREILPDPPEPTEGDLTRYFEAIASLVKDQEGWSVDASAIVVGFFSFGKFLIYRDLDPEVWPERARPMHHRIIKALLRDGYPIESNDPKISEPDLDRVAPAEQTRHVLDADATQALALWDIARGRDLVIQGPPGTGKSQTITNVIASAVASGKTVLFVAEKLAALEVVKRRLDASGIGDACLELHSHRTGKRTLLDELERTYTLGRPRDPADADDRAMLAETRTRLNAYAEAVHAEVGGSGVSPYQAINAILKPGHPSKTPLPPLPGLVAASECTPIDRKRRLALVAELQTSLTATGLPRDHPFQGTQRQSWPPTETDRLRDCVQDASKANDRLKSASAALAKLLHVAEPVDRNGCTSLLKLMKRTSRASHGINISADDWVAQAEEITSLIAAGEALTALHARLDETLLPDAWRETLDEARRTANIDGIHWWQRLSADYRAAIRALKGLYRGTPPETLPELIATADAILAAQRHQETIQKLAPLASRLFGDHWKGEHSDWTTLKDLADWAIRLHLDIQSDRLPSGLLDFLADRPSQTPVRHAVDNLKAALAVHHDAIETLSNLLEYEHNASCPLLSRPFDHLRDLFQTWARRADDLPALVALNRLAGLCRAEGLGAVVDLAEVWPGAAMGLTDAVERHYEDALIRRAFSERPALAGFDALGHEQAVRNFARLDRQVLAENRALVALAHWEKLPKREGGGQLGSLLREFEKKARHLPVRQLLIKAGRAVQAIKPVFMMSPMSVAAYLEPGGLTFDLVVFDEASQVRPVEALGALLRGSQAVVVGDSKQLPPSSFFERLTGVNEDETDDDPDDADTSDVESLLGLFLAAGAPERMLRWHYRSRHESLIAVSNREFYAGKLAVFPSPDARRSGSGLTLRRLSDTVYDRGGSRTNSGEAKAVAQAVLDHARQNLSRPAGDRLTLGVVAFSAAQAGAILDQLEDLRADDPSAEPFFTPGGPEPFFVKSLENVQGDERDVIVISVGYGRGAGGQLAMNFGPLNGEGGERRLNVLITRARVRCEVFTNFSSAEIDLNRTRSRGVRALKTFLAHAESGQPDFPRSNLEPKPTSDGFTDAIRASAESLGLTVRTEIGAAGLAPDLAVVDPERPDGPVIGVITDAPGGRTARDRERLRTQVLESLGWRIQRAWSTDWARDPSNAARRLREAVLGNSKPTDPPSIIPVAPVSRDDPASDLTRPSAADVYRQAEIGVPLDLNNADPAEIATRLVAIVQVEGPVHRDEAERRLSEMAGVKRLSPRLRETLNEAAKLALADATITARGDFLWPIGLDFPVVRDRSALPPASRRFDLIAPEELDLAVLTVVRDALGMPADAVPTASCRLLGFARVGDEMRARVDETLARLIDDRRLVKLGDDLILGPIARQETFRQGVDRG